MIYVNKLKLVSEYDEIEFMKNEKRSYFNTFYPFKIFTDKGLPVVNFGHITMLYGGNGSGKSTLVNILADKINANRYSQYNDAPLFNTYTSMCSVEYNRRPLVRCVLTSDDVFDYVLKARSVNDGIDRRRNNLVDKYIAVKRESSMNPYSNQLKSLDDYERWKETRQILSPANSQSKYVKDRVPQDIDLFSNGETAMKYFVDSIDADGVYILDEPENSLSIERQIELSQYIQATARLMQSQFIIATHSPVLLSMKGAVIYNLDAYPVQTCQWTQLPNVRKYYDFFMEHSEEFDS